MFSQDVCFILFSYMLWVIYIPVCTWTACWSVILNIFELLVPNLLTVCRDRWSSLNTVICNKAHQSWSVIILTDLRRPTSVTHLRDAKWGRIQNPPVMLRVNWSIKIPAALLQLETALSVSDQPVSTSDTTSTISWLNFKTLYLHCSTPGQNRPFYSSLWAGAKDRPASQLQKKNNQRRKYAISVSAPRDVSRLQEFHWTYWFIKENSEHVNQA